MDQNVETSFPPLKRYAWLSILAAIITILLKGYAWWLTGSVGLLSDAIESFINLAGALMAMMMLILAAMPADDKHAFGHTKAEYFSSGFEGGLILLAAVSISYASIERLFNPQPLEAVGVGLFVSFVASAVNLVVARILMRAGRQYRSITLEADAHHLMADVWTSVGVIIGVGLVGVTGWLWFDAIVALLVAINIAWVGWRLILRSIEGLMDISLSGEELAKIESVLETYRQQGLDFHALRTRQSGRRAFVTFHVLVPGHWTVKKGHDLADRIEQEIRTVIPCVHITTHLEPKGDPASDHGQALD